MKVFFRSLCHLMKILFGFAGGVIECGNISIHIPCFQIFKDLHCYGKLLLFLLQLHLYPCLLHLDVGVGAVGGGPSPTLQAIASPTLLVRGFNPGSVFRQVQTQRTGRTIVTCIASVISGGTARRIFVKFSW